MFIGSAGVDAETPINLTTCCEELTHWKRPWCWEGLRAGGERDDRGWDGWMASPTRWTWVWVNSRSWWWTGRPGVLQFTRSQRVGHDWATELNWTDWTTETGEIVKGLPIFMPERKALRFPQLWDYKKFPLIVGTLKMILNNLKTCAKWPPGILLCFSDGSVVKNSPVNTCQCRGGGFDPSVSQIPRRRKWQPTQYFCLGNPMDRRDWQATAHGVVKGSDTT